MKNYYYNYKKNNTNKIFIEILLIGLLSSVMFISPNASLPLYDYFQENQQTIPFITSVISGDSEDHENSKPYSTMKQIHVIVKETSPYLGIFALIYSIVNNFLNNQENSDDGNYLPRDNIPTKNPGYSSGSSEDGNDFPPLDDENSDTESDKNDDTTTLDTSSKITDFYFEDYGNTSNDSNIDDKCYFDCISPTLGLDKRIMNQILKDGFTINGNTIEVQRFYQDIPVQTFTVSLYDTANALFAQERYHEAREYLKKIVEITPHNANLYANIAVTYFNEYEYDLALDYVNKALNIDPRNNKALGLKSWILAELGHYKDAGIIGNVALGLNPINTDVVMSKAVITSNMNKIEISNNILIQP